MGIFSRKYDNNGNNSNSSHFDELRKLIQLIGTKVAILESRIEGVSANVASIRNRLNRSFRESDEFETSDIESQTESKTEAINNPVLLPEDGVIRKNSKRR